MPGPHNDFPRFAIGELHAGRVYEMEEAQDVIVAGPDGQFQHVPEQPPMYAPDDRNQPQAEPYVDMWVRQPDGRIEIHIPEEHMTTTATTDPIITPGTFVRVTKSYQDMPVGPEGEVLEKRGDRMSALVYFNDIMKLEYDLEHLHRANNTKETRNYYYIPFKHLTILSTIDEDDTEWH